MPRKSKTEYRYLLVVDRLLEAQARLMPVPGRENETGHYRYFLHVVGDLTLSYLQEHQDKIRLKKDVFYLFRAFILVRLQAEFLFSLPNIDEAAETLAQNDSRLDFDSARYLYARYWAEELYVLADRYPDAYESHYAEEAVEYVFARLPFGKEDLKAGWLLELPLMTYVEAEHQAAIEAYAFGIHRGFIGATESERKRLAENGEEAIEMGPEGIYNLKAQYLMSDMANKIRASRNVARPWIYSILARSEAGQKVYVDEPQSLDVPSGPILEEGEINSNMLKYFEERIVAPRMFISPTGAMLRRDRIRSRLLIHQAKWASSDPSRTAPFYREEEPVLLKGVEPSNAYEASYAAVSYFGRRVSTATLNKHGKSDHDIFINCASEWFNRMENFSGVYTPWYMLQ